MAKRREIDKRCEAIRDLVQENRFDDAWELVRDLSPEDMDSVMDLRNMAKVQEKTNHYDEMKETYLHLFNTTNVRHNLKEFIEVLIRIREFGDAKVYLKEFEKMDGAVADDFDLRYAMAEAIGMDEDAKISLLEDFKKEEYMESWGRKLAEAYKKAGREEDYKQEMADLHLWFGGARILPDEEEKVDPEETLKVRETSENLAARMEAESEIVSAINEKVGAEVSRIVEEGLGEGSEQKPASPTLDELLSQTGRTEIERLEVEPPQPVRMMVEDPQPVTQEAPQYVTQEAPQPAIQEEPQYTMPEEPQSVMQDEPAESYDAQMDAPAVESVGMPRTASGGPVPAEEHVSFEAKYLNRRGQAETVGTPVKTDNPSKARRLEQMFAVGDDYEEGPEDVSGRGIRYWTPRDVVSKLRRRDYEPPHFVLAGGEEKITLTMTKKISKELSRIGYTSAQKVMRITAERMNQLRLIDQIDRLLGRCLLVTEAAELTNESVDQLLQVMHEFGEEFVVVLSGPFDEMDCFLQIHPDLSELLGYKVRMVY